ncbi:MAG: flagellar biosynthetic protein FliP, partial [Clostridia bacterium]|nr:flagellar biosynthetic protein FliP [Clostridia bacterium]
MFSLPLPGSFLCICTKIPVHATGAVDIGERHLTGTTEERTNINEPGTSSDAEELGELNIANNLTITYTNDNGEMNGALRILITLTLIAIAPTLIILLTSFTRIIIVLHFTRNALNTTSAPPNQVIIGLALFLTFFIMNPVITQIRTEAIEPFDAGIITQEEALEIAMNPLREFMYRETQTKDVQMFMDISGTKWTGSLED